MSKSTKFEEKFTSQCIFYASGDTTQTLEKCNMHKKRKLKVISLMDTDIKFIKNLKFSHLLKNNTPNQVGFMQ